MTALELADRLASGWPALEDVNKAVRELRRLAELERDAARYRWLRDEAQWRDDPVPQAIIFKRNGHAEEICAEEDLDAAIDEAMEQSK